MKNINYFICLLVCCSSFVFTACSDDDNSDTTNDSGVWDAPLRGSIATDETVDEPAVILGTLPAELSDAFNTRLTNVTNTVGDGTKILVVPCSELSAFTTDIVTVYENNGIIVIASPEPSVANGWFEQMGLSYELPDDSVAKELFAFNKHHQYILDAPYEGITRNEHLNHFVDWANDVLDTFSAADPESGESAIDKLVDAQTITHTFGYKLEVVEAKAILSKPDKITGNGTFTAKYSIYALYAFENQPSNGDYYIVNAEYTAHNATMCPVDESTHRWTSRHGGVYCMLCGFYMTKFGVETSLCDNENSTTTIGEFPTGYTPSPQTTQGSTSYTSGMNWGFGGDATFGMDTKGPSGSVTVKGNLSFSNSQTRNIADVDILNQSNASAAKYVYVVNNLPEAEKSHITTPPLVSVSNATLFGSWIWRVPTTKNGSKDEFWLCTNLSDIEFGSCHLYSTALDFVSHTNRPDISNRKAYSKIIPPNRVPTGLLKISNTNEGQYISDIVIANEQGQVEYTTKGKGSIPFNDAFLRYVPVGKYTIEFKMGSNNQSLKNYVLATGPIEIDVAEEYGLNSAFDFEEK